MAAHVQRPRHDTTPAMPELALPATHDGPYIELRQYTMQPGGRDVLIEMFERLFLAPLEALGAEIPGTFRQADAPDRFVWLRQFRDLRTRHAALDGFYSSPLWLKQRSAANATMIDSDDVLLLEPVAADTGFQDLPPLRSQPMGAACPDGVVLATIWLLKAPADAMFSRWFDSHVLPRLVAAGAVPLARLRTAYVSNNYPRLPVREGEHAYVVFQRFADAAALDTYQSALAADPQWLALQAPIAAHLARPLEQLRLLATDTSRLRACVPDPRAGHEPGRHDFDFIAGRWVVEQRRLLARGVGSDQWDHFTGQQTGQLYLDGLVNVDQLDVPARGWSGMTIRAFDRAAAVWRIHWISSLSGVLFAPVQGRFENALGTFFGEDSDDGRPVRVKFLWHTGDRDAPRWEQYFSYDEGARWELNWVMQFRRVG